MEYSFFQIGPIGPGLWLESDTTGGASSLFGGHAANKTFKQ